MRIFQIYEETRGVLKVFLENVIRDAVCPNQSGWMKKDEEEGGGWMKKKEEDG
jgi:hypothetical protein